MKRLFILFVSSMLCKTSFAQPDFNSIILCHDNKKTLSCISNDDYIVHFMDGLFSGFKTSDNIVQFNEASKTFAVKNVKPRNTKDSVITLQLTREGIVLKNSDSTVLLTKATSMNEDNPEAAVMDFFNFFVYLEYSEGKLYKISFNAGLKKIAVNIFEYKGSYYWDINGISKTNAFILEYTFSKLQLITLRDYTKKSGVNLYAKKNKNIFYLLELYEIDSSGLPKPQSKIFYTRSGVVKTKMTVLQIRECGCN